MDTEINDKFEKMGARVKVTRVPSHLMGRAPADRGGRVLPDPMRVRIDIRKDGDGEYFDVRHRTDVRVDVVDVRPKDRHLLLMARAPGHGRTQDLNSKFLCGHDERAWFVAAVPETARARDVQTAKDALKPQAVWDAIRKHGVRPDHRDRRRTSAFVRQGEWFFIPRPALQVNPNLVLRDEPIRRGAGKPHRCQSLYRTGGELVYVDARHPNGVTEDEFRRLPTEERSRLWRTMRRNARVFVRGTVRHPDHATIRLDCWHEVVMNTETQAEAMREVAFLD
jgi:hypothetical protein